MNFIEATDAPVVAQINGQTVEFSLWTVGDLSALAARLDARRIATANEAAKGLDPVDRAAVLQHASFLGTTPADLHRYFQTHVGGVECLTRSLVKSGQTEDQAAAIVSAMYAVEIQALAARVGRLIRPDPTEPARTPAS